MTKDQRPEPAAYQVKAFGVDRLYHGPIGDLPPVAARYRRIMDKLGALRSKMRRQPTHLNWRRWYDQAAELLKEREEIVPEMRRLGFRVFSRRGGLPTESHADLRLRRELDEEAQRDVWRTTAINEVRGWEVYDGIDEQMAALPFFHHHDPADAQPEELTMESLVPSKVRPDGGSGQEPA